jgi:SNF2 family DNA or RNA helicase
LAGEFSHCSPAKEGRMIAKFKLANRRPWMVIDDVWKGSPLESALRSLGASKDRRGPTWSLPLLNWNYDQLRLLSPDLEIDPEVNRFRESLNDSRKRTFHSFWKKNLLDFQDEAVQFLVTNPYPGALLALSPGLGKTVIASVALALLNIRRVLIICPRALVEVWRRELDKWARRTAAPAWGTDCPDDDLVITTFETLVKKTHGNSYYRGWDLLIIDESSRVKNQNTAAAMRVLRLRGSADRVWLLSGTPVTKHVDDLYSQFQIIWPGAFKSYWRFVNQFCLTMQTVWGTNIVGSKPMDFRSIFSDLMYVRQQNEVIELPDMIIERLSVPLYPEQSDVYTTLEKELIIKLEESEKIVPNRVASLTYLQELVSSPINLGLNIPSSKHDTVKELIDLVEPPCIIWVHWRAGADQLFLDLKERGLSVDCILGGDPLIDNKIQSFQDGDLDFLILSLGVGGMGLTLTRARTVIYLDRNWMMEDYVQSLYRVKRIGLDHKPKVYILHSPGTVDALVEQNLTVKSFDIHRVTNEDLKTLLRSLRNERTNSKVL